MRESQQPVAVFGPFLVRLHGECRGEIFAFVKKAIENGVHRVAPILLQKLESGNPLQDTTLLKGDRSPGKRKEGSCLPGWYTFSKIARET